MLNRRSPLYRVEKEFSDSEIVGSIRMVGWTFAMLTTIYDAAELQSLPMHKVMGRGINSRLAILIWNEIWKRHP